VDRVVVVQDRTNQVAQAFSVKDTQVAMDTTQTITRVAAVVALANEEWIPTRDGQAVSSTTTESVEMVCQMT